MTLLEAMVVLAVAAMIGAIGYPRLDQASRALDLREIRQAVALDLNRQRAAALRTGRPAVWRPLGAGRGYLLSDGAVRALPDGLVLAAPDEIRFLPDGSATGGAVTLTGPGGSVSLWVDPATGMVWRPGR